MSQAWRKARALFAAWLTHMTIYRAEIVIWMLSGTLPLIMMAVWIGKAQAEGGAVQGFSSADFAAYFLVAWMSGQMTVAWVAWEISFAVRQGTFSTKLLRPINPFWEYFMQHVTERVVRYPFVFVIMTIGALLVPGAQLVESAAHAGVYLLAIVLAFLIRFLIAYCIGLAAFWLENATALDELYFVLSIMLAGSFAPLDFYPAWLRPILEFLPFPYVIYYPTQILIGRLEWPEIARVVLIQLVWVAIFVALFQVLWRLGRRHYGAVGA
ncbi:MAG: ABC-2 family transporter protein [Meiothermus sp.]|nr:ABC-2 family transporter protein [Meiothermus sp.]